MIRAQDRDPAVSHDLPIYVWSGLGLGDRYVTGVGRHIMQMALALHQLPGLSVQLVVPPEIANHQNPKLLPLAEDAVRLPIARGLLDLAWTFLPAPLIDMWLKDRRAGWVYCPREIVTVTRRHRLAVTVHDLYAFEPGSAGTGIRQWLKRWRMSAMLSRADLVFVVSEFTRQRLLALFPQCRAPVVCVGNGVEESFFAAPASAMSLPAGVPANYVLCVGGLTRKKGAAAVIAMAKALADRQAGFAVVVVGPADPPFVDAVKNLPNLVHLGRGLDDDAMVALTQRAAVAVALSEYEGFGIPIIEAMAAGVPVVAADRHVFPEVVGDAGLLVDPADAEAVADAVLRTANDQTLRSELVGKGRARARACTWKACAERAAAALREYAPVADREAR